jgi:hypothetical protein
MAGLRARIRTIQHAEEVRRRSLEPELQRTVVKRDHADAAVVALASGVVVESVLKDEVDRRRGAGPTWVEYALDPELDVVRGQRVAVRPARPGVQVEQVAKPVGRDLPPLGERRHDRPLRPRLDQPVEQLHAELDIRPGDGRIRISVAGEDARRNPQRLRRGHRCWRAPQSERLPVGRVGLGEAKRGMERERQLEQDERHLLLGAASFQQRQQLPVVADRLVECVFLAGPVACPGEIVERPVLVACGEPVVGEQPERIAQVICLAVLQPFGGAPVQPGACRRDERPVGDLLDQHMLEAVLRLRPPALCADQVGTLQFMQYARNLAVPEHALQQGQAEPPPQRRRGRDDAPALRVQPVESREHHLLHRLRDLHLSLLVETPAAALRHHCAGVHERAHQFLQEERISLRDLEHAAFELGRKRALPHQSVQQLALRLARQRLEGQLAHQMRVLARSELLQAPRGEIPLTALGHRQQQRRALSEGEQPLSELHRRRISPVQVLQRQRERTVRCEPVDELDHDLERAVLERFGREFRQARGGIGVECEPEQRAEIRISRGRLLAV